MGGGQSTARTSRRHGYRNRNSDCHGTENLLAPRPRYGFVFILTLRLDPKQDSLSVRLFDLIDMYHRLRDEKDRFHVWFHKPLPIVRIRGGHITYWASRLFDGVLVSEVFITLLTMLFAEACTRL